LQGKADAIELERPLLIELLGELGRHTESVGAVLILELLNRYETHLLHTLQDAVEVCQAVGSPYVQTMADLFHMSIEEADIPASIEKAGEHIYHVHLADSNRKLPGLGHTDFAAALKGIGYDKYMTLECGEPSQNAPLKGYYAQELPRSLDFLREFL
jgi:sugar phosphate isomerase/epimerase